MSVHGDLVIWVHLVRWDRMGAKPFLQVKQVKIGAWSNGSQQQPKGAALLEPLEGYLAGG